MTTGGYTVPLPDVEAVLRAVDGVVDVVCAGEPDARLGQRLVAIVQTTAGHDLGPQLRAAARANLPRPARPVRWIFTGRLPLLANGKVDRRACRP